ncbi:MAG: hypothetical protein MR646_03510 [Agathobacter sp.]|nr:hypothetical protein [Agathobacter sp.]
MMDMNGQPEQGSFIEKVLEEYYKYFSLNVIDVDIMFSSRISDAVMKIRPDYLDGEIRTRPEEIDKYRGMIIPPREREGKFTIVISYYYLLDSCQRDDFQWVGTLVHEMTHVQDYVEYADMHDMKSYDKIQRRIEHRPFALWTEFNAKAKGYFFMSKYQYSESYTDIYDKTHTDFILQKELPFQIKAFNKSCSAAEGNMDEQLYSTMQFLGRYSVWENLFPNIFDKNMREKVMEGNKQMYNLYLFLIEHQKLEDADKEWDKMMEAIGGNYYKHWARFKAE